MAVLQATCCRPQLIEARKAEAARPRRHVGLGSRRWRQQLQPTPCQGLQAQATSPSAWLPRASKVLLLRSASMHPASSSAFHLVVVVGGLAPPSLSNP